MHYQILNFFFTLFQQWTNENPVKLPAIIPWQGPFHVALNAEESTVLLFWPFFEQLYKGIFGHSKKFPKKPRAEKISTVTTAAFGGWLLVRDMVLELFGQCKDPQYIMLFHLLDELCCVNFFYYPAIFRGGNFNMWLHAMMRVAMLFINFNRRNYNKATLCQLSDLLFHLSDNPELADRFQTYLQVFTEKKIEILHSVFRR